MRVAVIGTGLIGTSVALALREQGVSVWLADTDPEAARLAANLGAGELLPEMGPEMGRADIAVIAATACSELSGAGHSAQVRPRNRSARAAAGPCFSRPASGWLGT